MSAAVTSLPVLLTVDETADLLRTTRKAVYALVERGQLAGVRRLGRRVLVHRDELLDSLCEKRAPSPGRIQR
jgi:excisionase family DNA binding protein